MQIRWRTKAIGLFCTIVMLSGCSLLEEDLYTNYQIGDRTIKVLDNQHDVVYNQFILEQVESYADLRGMDWLNEEEVLVVASHKQMNPNLPMGGESYWRNLFLFDSKTKQKKLLLAETIDHGAAYFSPNKQYVYFHKFSGGAASSYLMNTATKEMIEAVGDEEHPIEFNSRPWIAENKVLVYTNLPSDGSRIIEIDNNGKRNILLRLNQKWIQHVSGKGDMIYYIVSNGKDGMDSEYTLYSFHKKTKKVEEIDKQVEQVVLSPKGDKLAIIKRIEQSQRNLMILDIKSRKSSKIAEVEGINGIHHISWSPDQKLLAYSSVSYSKKGKRGLFVADVNKGKSTQVSVDLQDLSDPIMWSPSGRKLLVSQYEYNKQKKQIPYLYIITLSTKSPSK